MAWEWPKTDRVGLARFVLKEASVEIALELNRNDLRQDATGRRKLVEAIYFELQNKGVRYALEKYHPDDAVQLIRSPSEIFGQKEGTCLDLALIFCGICLGYELLSLPILIDGHAFAAVNLNYDIRTRGAYDRKERKYFEYALLTDASVLRQFIDDGAYVAIECTGVAQTQTIPATYPEGVGRDFRGFLAFERAVAAGREQLNVADRPFLFALDVAAANDLGIKPSEVQSQPRGGAGGRKVILANELKGRNLIIKNVTGVTGDPSGIELVDVLNQADLEGVEIGDLTGVDNSAQSKDPQAN